MAKTPTAAAAATTANEPATSAPANEQVVGEVVATESLSQRAVSAVKTPELKFKVVKQVTRPLLKHRDGDTVYIKFLGRPYVGKEVKSATKMEPATLVNVINHNGGGSGEWQYILSSVLYHKDDKTNEESGVLMEEYPNHTYVGKSFAIRKFAKEEGKRYNTFELVEIEVDA